jgi:hypothetical protein
MNAVHNFSTDTFKIALYSLANGANLSSTTTVYSATGEVTGSPYVAGGATLTVSQTPTSSGTPSTTAFVNFANVTWSGAAITADGALIYNSSKANRAVAVLNFGGTKTKTNFSVTFPIAGTGASIIQIA